MARREAALTSLTDSGLDLTLTTDSSFIREIVHHLADSDDIWKICIKAALGNNDSSFSLQCYWDKPKLDWSILRSPSRQSAIYFGIDPIDS